MNDSLKKYYLFLKWFLVIIVLEVIIIIFSFNKEFFLFKILINYLFLAGTIPLIVEKIYKGTIDLFSPLVVFTFFYLLFFGIRALDSLIFNADLIREDEQFYTQALIYAIIGLHFFQIGYFSKISQVFRKINTRIQDNWSITKFKIVLVGYSLISLLSFFIIIKLSGGISLYFSNIRDAMVSITSGATIFFISALLIKVPLIIWFCYALKRRRFSFSFLLFSVMVVFLLISLGERGHFITLIISLLVCYHYLRKRVRLFHLFSLAIGLILFLVIFGQYRDFTEQSYKIKKSGLKLQVGVVATYHYFIGHFDQLRHVKDVIKFVPDELDFQYGKTFLNLLVKPIPSVIWEGKPQGAGSVITKTIYPKASSLGVTVAPSLLGELYLNLHVAGIILGMFLFGFIGKALYLFLLNNQQNRNVVIIYAICLPFVFSELRGDFTVVTSFLIFNLIFLIIALKYITVKNV